MYDLYDIPFRVLFFPDKILRDASNFIGSHRIKVHHTINTNTKGTRSNLYSLHQYVLLWGRDLGQTDLYIAVVKGHSDVTSLPLTYFITLEMSDWS